MPEPGPLGETFFEASVRAMVPASLLNTPSGGCVESVLTFPDHFFVALAMVRSVTEMIHHKFFRASRSAPTSMQSEDAENLVRQEWRLKYCTSRSCCLAASSVLKVPRLRRFPVDVSFLREYKRYCPDFSFRIMIHVDAPGHQCAALWRTTGVAAGPTTAPERVTGGGGRWLGLQLQGVFMMYKKKAWRVCTLSGATHILSDSSFLLRERG
jgi:hypothetical protein